MKYTLIQGKNKTNRSWKIIKKTLRQLKRDKFEPYTMVLPLYQYPLLSKSELSNLYNSYKEVIFVNYTTRGKDCWKLNANGGIKLI